MNHQPLLSVIVPCYNVEKYVDKCILSIVNQTYPNLEILLVDDGSTDQTGMLCDAWQEKDERIRVIHKQNVGLSYARKTGVENAVAEIVGFVDSDDWIAPNMYADMISAMILTDSDIAQCDYCEVTEDDPSPSPPERGEKPEVIGREEGVLLILVDKKWKSYMWNKIFKKHLFDHIVFPKGRIFEDIPIMFSLFHHATRSVYLPAKYYRYFRRSDSIIQIKNMPAEMKRRTDHSMAFYERYLFVSRHPEYHSALPPVTSIAIRSGVHLLGNMIDYSRYFSGDSFKVKANQIISIPDTQGYRLLSFSVKIQLFVLKLSPGLYRVLRSFYYRIIHVTNKLKITDKRFKYIYE